MNPTTAKIGLNFGLLLPAEGVGVKQEPVAYLYNGVRLPKLPEWDKEKYPYALLYEYWDYSAETHSGNYSLDILNTKLRLDIHSYYPQEAYTATRYAYSRDDDSYIWRLTHKDVVNPRWQPGKHSRYVWANFDFLSVDGSIVIATSPDPAPIYE